MDQQQQSPMNPITPTTTATTTTTTTTTNTSTSNNNNMMVISLENCLLPESKFISTPSSLDGLDSQTEYELRILGTELVQTSGILLKLPQVAMATGQVLFQRFYYSKSFVRHKMEITAMACTLLASKIEEAPRRIRDVVNVFNHMRQVRAGIQPYPILLDQNYINLKAKIIKAERQLLKELGFCVHVKHPHKFIVTLLQVLELKDNKQLMQNSWNYMNDSLRTDVFLRYLPETIACACIYLSANLLRIPLPSNPAWYELFDASEADLEAICSIILKLYSQKKPDQAKLEGIIDSLRRQWENSQKDTTFASTGGNGGNEDVKNGESTHSETPKDDEMPLKVNDNELKVSSTSPKPVKDVFERLKKRSPSYESSSSPKYDVNMVNNKARSTLKTRDNISTRYRDSYDNNSKSRRTPSRDDHHTNSHRKRQSRSKDRSKDYDDYKSYKKHKEDKDYYSSSKEYYSSKESSKYYVKERSRKHSRHSNRDRDGH